MKIEKSVKDIVSYVYQEGDLNLEYFQANRAQHGTHAHQVVQKNYPKECVEVHLEQSVSYQDHEFVLGGRMDLFLKEEERLIVGEIKSTTRRLDKIQENDRPIHYAQAKCYAYLYLLKYPLHDQMTIRLIYCDLSGTKTRHFDQTYTKDELALFMQQTLAVYIDWHLMLVQGMSQTLQTKKTLTFPFGEFRQYQRELSGSVYHCIKHKKLLLLRAPTGIGKTMGTLFPAIKALRKQNQKIFYLTAKTIGRDVAQKAVGICQAKGFKGRATTITAKDKICFQDEVKCDPQVCMYAKNYFNKINEATKALYRDDILYSRETIEVYAKKYEVCPFEYSLAMASISDIIIADYNYMFDPRAYLRRFFDEPSSHIALVDEAHNLYDRACEMYSASLIKEPISELHRHFKHQNLAVSKSLSQLHLMFIELRRLLDDYQQTDYFMTDLDQRWLLKIEEAIEDIERYLYQEPDDEHKKALMTLYFDLFQFSRIASYFTDDFLVRLQKFGADVKLSIVCLNPSQYLVEKMALIQSTVLFSATLHPMNYYETVLLHNQPCEQLFIPSPFNREHLSLHVDTQISTKYKARPYSIRPLATKIAQMTRNQIGNYLVFFPSHEYLEQVLAAFESLEVSDVKVLKQERVMDEEMREQFLAAFVENPDKSLVGFCVLGGIFGEGIDLTDTRLIGALIVGVGLPQVNPLTEARREYFSKQFDLGYEYAYVYPGFNKVMQAVGRVIRTETDQGVVTLVDDRYKTKTYLSLFPYEWQHATFD